MGLAHTLALLMWRRQLCRLRIVGYASAWGAHTQKYEVSSRVAAEMGPNLDMGQSEKHSLEGRHE